MVIIYSAVAASALFILLLFFLLRKKQSNRANLKQEASIQVNRPRCLKIVNAEGHAWGFPWSTFRGAYIEENVESSDNGEKIDRITLLYIHHKVILKGLNLGQCQKGIHEGTLENLRVADREYEKTMLRRNEPVIRSVEVTAHGISQT
jgi:hypothetical protein